MSKTHEIAEQAGSGDDAPAPAQRGRILTVDVARAIALFAMAIFHFTWDLDFFGYVPRGMATSGGWEIFARCIASSFLFLVGFSLILAHDRGIRWQPYLVRLGQVAAGALAITVITMVITPESFVFFGILHHIVLASLVGLMFRRLPWFVTLAIGLGVIALPAFFRSDAFDPIWLVWVGLFETAPLSNDFVPVFPFFGVVLTGIAMGRMSVDHGLIERLRKLDGWLGPLRKLEWFGRHSLAFYLIHQPVLFGLVWVFAQFAPPDPDLAFARDCRQACIASESQAFCERYCTCTRSELETANLFAPLMDGTAGETEMTGIRAITRQCSISAAPIP